jgi:hypothetical protein
MRGFGRPLADILPLTEPAARRFSVHFAANERQADETFGLPPVIGDTGLHPICSYPDLLALHIRTSRGMVAEDETFQGDTPLRLCCADQNNTLGG